MRISFDNSVFSPEDREEFISLLRKEDNSLNVVSLNSRSSKGIENTQVITWIITLSSALMPTVLKILYDWYKERRKKDDNKSIQLIINLPISENDDDVCAYITAGQEEKNEEEDTNGT